MIGNVLIVNMGSSKNSFHFDKIFKNIESYKYYVYAKIKMFQNEERIFPEPRKICYIKQVSFIKEQKRAVTYQVSKAMKSVLDY